MRGSSCFTTKQNLMNLNNELLEWYESTERDITIGAELLLRINRNRILYNHIKIKRDGERLEYEIRKILDERTLIGAYMCVPEKKAAAVTSDGPDASDPGNARKGKRTDHDSLPARIAVLYDKALLIYPQMRNLHVRLKLENSDENRAAIVGELKGLEYALASAWEVYDAYVFKEESAPEISAKRVQTNRKYLSDNRKNGWKNLDKKREEIQKRIDEIDSAGENISQELRDELQSLGFSCK